MMRYFLLRTTEEERILTREAPRRLAASPFRAVRRLWQAVDCWMGQEQQGEALRLLFLRSEGLPGQ